MIDVDDTLINSEPRTRGVWREVLGVEVPLQAVEDLSALQIFEKYASSDQKAQVNELRKRFQNILFCREETGIELFGLDEPVPFAADVLQEWSKNSKLVYLTGRLENLRDLTLGELRRFGFPMDDVQLVMFGLEDWENARRSQSPGAALVEARSRLFSSISKQNEVIRVVDDYPGYFTIYRKFSVPERIGLMRSKRYSQEDYLSRGATRVVENWRQLQGYPPKLR